MDLFKKTTLKSQSLNSRFLASNTNNSHAHSPSYQQQNATQILGLPVRSLPAQQIEPAAPTLAGPSHQSSKLKLTTSRPTSTFRSARDQNASPTTVDQVASISRDLAQEKKTPVWNKGMPISKSSKNYTDEELKAMHGISLVSRSSNPGEKKEGRWDDSDEDDDWGDTIDFGDGTKVVVGQTPVEQSTATDEIQKPIDTLTERNHVNGPHVDENLSSRSSVNPWRKPEETTVMPDAREYQDAYTSRSSLQQNGQSNERRPSIPQQDRQGHGIGRSPGSERGYDHRERSDSFNRDGRMQQSGDARYQYEQNTFDRRWHQPPPQTREIFNSTTGKMEQIDASHAKAMRRPSHNDRRPTELLHRTSIDNKKGIAEKVLTNGSSAIAPTVAATNSGEPVDVAPAPPLDPSSQEFIDMQKKLMATAREQAIQRRKDQETEELARKERTRKKAAELAAIADQEQQEAKRIAMKLKEDAKEQAKSKALPEKKLSTAKLSNVNGSKTQGQMGSDTLDDSWQRANKLPTSVGDRRPISARSAQSDVIASTSLNSRTTSSDEQSRDYSSSSSRNVWGPIGLKTTPSKNDSTREPMLGSFSLDETKTDSPPSRGQADRPGWSVFDGITKPHPQRTEGREYNVFDAADEELTPERLRQTGQQQQQQAQSSRTSSRFFPSPATAVQQPSVRTAAHVPHVPFTSPALPPSIDSSKHDLYATFSGLPELNLPDASIRSSLELNGAGARSLDQVMAFIKTNIQTQPQHRQYGRHARDFLDTQTRTVWDVKPRKEASSPRIKLPISEKTLDWTRKVKAEEYDAPSKAKSQPVVTTTTTIPASPAWILPQTLETTTRLNVLEPLVTPSPSLKLPAITEGNSAEVFPTGPRKGSRRLDQDRLVKYYTTRPHMSEDTDNTSPIRIKVADRDATKISRRFGKRAEALTVSKKIDVKRQPVNMSDAPGTANGKDGLKQGFTNRVRKMPPGLPPGLETPVLLRRGDDHASSSPAPTPSQGPPGISMPMA